MLPRHVHGGLLLLLTVQLLRVVRQQPFLPASLESGPRCAKRLRQLVHTSEKEGSTSYIPLLITIAGIGILLFIGCAGLRDYTFRSTKK